MLTVIIIGGMLRLFSFSSLEFLGLLFLQQVYLLSLRHDYHDSSQSKVHFINLLHELVVGEHARADA